MKSAALKKSSITQDISNEWKTLTLDEVAEINPTLNKREIADDLEVSFVAMPSVGAGDGRIDVSQIRPFSEVKKGFTNFKDGDVLFAKITPCMENGKMAIAHNLKNGFGFGSTEFHILRPKEFMDSRYIYYFVSNTTFRNKAGHNMTGAVGQKRVSTTYLKEQTIPVPPLQQQKQIVAKIEELFSHIDAGIDALKQSKKLLKQYRQSVLKAAVTGELSKEWREQNAAHGCANVAKGQEPVATKDKLEPASELLERILHERRQKWEAQQLEQFKAKGKVPKDEGWKAKYEAPLQANELDLPEGWATISIDQLTHFVTSGSRGWAGYYSEAGSLFIRAQNIKYDRLELDDIAYVDLPEGAEGLRTKVSFGDLLITITGANVTKSALVDKVLDDAYVSQHVALCRIIDPELSAYLYLYVVCQHGGRRILEKAAYGAGKPGLNLENVRSLPVPLPSFAEIGFIQSEVEKKIFAIASMEASIDLELKRSERLKQSVLQSAFTGVLANE